MSFSLVTMYRLLFLVYINAALGKVLTTQGHPVQQYIHVTAVPSFRSSPQSRPQSQNIGVLVPTQIPKPQPEPIPIPLPPKSPSPPPTSKSTNPSKKDAPTLDSNVLNNLAIALQLLIVSNILNLPPQEANSEIASKMAMSLEPNVELPYSSPPFIIESPPPFIIESPKYETGPKYSIESLLAQYAEPAPVPNANYLASAGFTEPSVYGPFTPMPKPSSRTELGFMSPYDAMASNSPYSDPTVSTSYGSSPSKRDFKSPYAAIMSDNKDVFSMFDLF